jgi:putative flippase GtrA
MKIRKQILFFFVVGCTSLLIDWGVYFFLLYRLEVDPLHSKTISFTAGAMSGFVFNGIFTFKSQLNFIRLIQYIVLYTVSLALNIVTFGATLNRNIGSDAFKNLIALMVATTVSSTLNFLGMRKWVFRIKRGIQIYES